MRRMSRTPIQRLSPPPVSSTNGKRGQVQATRHNFNSESPPRHFRISTSAKIRIRIFTKTSLKTSPKKGPRNNLRPLILKRRRVIAHGLAPPPDSRIHDILGVRECVLVQLRAQEHRRLVAERILIEELCHI